MYNISTKYIIIDKQHKVPLQCLRSVFSFSSSRSVCFLSEGVQFSPAVLYITQQLNSSSELCLIGGCAVLHRK